MRAKKKRANPWGQFRAILLGVALVLATTTALGQENGQPDKHGEVWSKEPRHPQTGQGANVPIKLELRQRNTGGSDGAGLCVIASVTTAGRKQGVPGIDRIWEAAKKRPGGYWPNRLEKLATELLPGEKFGSYTGSDTEVVERLVKAGYPVGTTMNTGALYGYQPIHHMVTTVHLDDSAGAIIDNNKPEVYTWMPRKEYDRRFVDGSEGWAFNWARRPPLAGVGLIALVTIGVVIGVLASLFWTTVLESANG